MEPICLCTFSTVSIHRSFLVTSISKASARASIARTEESAGPNFSELMSSKIGTAPRRASSRAVSSPIPWAEPVIRATLPFNGFIAFFHTYL